MLFFKVFNKNILAKKMYLLNYTILWLFIFFLFWQTREWFCQFLQITKIVSADLFVQCIHRNVSLNYQYTAYIGFSKT